MTLAVMAAILFFLGLAQGFFARDQWMIGAVLWTIFGMLLRQVGFGSLGATVWSFFEGIFKLVSGTI